MVILETVKQLTSLTMKRFFPNAWVGLSERNPSTHMAKWLFINLSLQISENMPGDVGYRGRMTSKEKARTNKYSGRYIGWEVLGRISNVWLLYLTYLMGKLNEPSNTTSITSSPSPAEFEVGFCTWRKVQPKLVENLIFSWHYISLISV